MDTSISKPAGILSPLGVGIPIRELIASMGSNDAYIKARNKFKVSTRNFQGRFDVTQIYQSNMKNNIVIFPRIGGFKFLHDGHLSKIHNYIPVGDVIKVKFTGTLKSNQVSIKDHFIDEIYTEEKIKLGNAGAVLKLTAGQGKTFIAMGLIDHFQVKTLYITPNHGVCKQVVKVLEEQFPGAKIGQYHGKKKSDGDIIVAVVHSVAKLDASDADNTAWFSQFGFVIFDEIHDYCSKTKKTIFQKAQAPRVLGLTATPDRLDKLDKIFRLQIGEVIDAEEDIPTFTKSDKVFTGRVEEIRYHGHPDYLTAELSSAGGVLVPLILNKIIQDPYRNEWLINRIIGLYKENRFVFVFSERRSHLDLIQERLKQLGIFVPDPNADDKKGKGKGKGKGKIVPNVNAIVSPDDNPTLYNIMIQHIIKNIDKYNPGKERSFEGSLMKSIFSQDMLDRIAFKAYGPTTSIIRGKSTNKDISDATQYANIILTTYQFSSTGISIDKLDTDVYATPRKNKMKQIRGRILRLGGDSSIERVSIDMVDWKTALKGQVYERRKDAKDKGFPIANQTVKWEDVQLSDELLKWHKDFWIQQYGDDACGGDQNLIAINI
jgi:hypothetical protein